MNIIEMKMMDEYYENNRSILDDLYNKPISELTFYEKQKWLKNNVNYTQLMEFALDNTQIINILYEHFHKK